MFASGLTCAVGLYDHTGLSDATQPNGLHIMPIYTSYLSSYDALGVGWCSVCVCANITFADVLERTCVCVRACVCVCVQVAGNHEILSNSVIELLLSPGGFVDSFRSKYVTSNVVLAGTDKPLGSR